MALSHTAHMVLHWSEYYIYLQLQYDVYSIVIETNTNEWIPVHYLQISNIVRLSCLSDSDFRCYK